MINIDTELKMKKAIESLDQKLINIRTGRANPSMLNGVMVDYYGNPTAIQAVANISVPEARQINIKPFDKSSLRAIEKAIGDSELGLAPINNGDIIILNIPELTEERRKEFVKLAKATGEEAKVALRNIRQDANNDVKKLELPEDEEKKELENIQDLITKYNKVVDERIIIKEKELMAV